MFAAFILQSTSGFAEPVVPWHQATLQAHASTGPFLWALGNVQECMQAEAEVTGHQGTGDATRACASTG